MTMPDIRSHDRPDAREEACALTTQSDSPGTFSPCALLATAFGLS